MTTTHLDGTLIKMKAAIAPVADETDPNGEFSVVLATPDKDREGESALHDEWKTPLPDHITFDSDHGMDVKSLVGSGTPTLTPDGQVLVKGTYAGTPHAQTVRQLVNEKHIRNVSVTFLSRKVNRKDAAGATVKGVERELLNGSFVAVPANPNAVVLSSKSATASDGADGTAPVTPPIPNPAEMLQAIHNAAVHLGAMCLTESEIADADVEQSTGTKALGRSAVTIVTKGIKGSVEDLQQRVSAAIRKAAAEREYPWVRATFLDDSTSKGTVVYELDGPAGRAGTFARGFTDAGTEVTLDAETRSVSLVTTVVDDPEPNAGAQKNLDVALALLVDTGMTRDEAEDFLGVSTKGVPSASSGTAAAQPAAAAGEPAAAADTAAAVGLAARTSALLTQLDASAG